MAKSRLDFLKSKLTAQQIKAVYLLVENEIKDNLDEAKLNLGQIADEVGVDRMTLYRWRTRNPHFIEFKNLVADDFLASDRDRVYAVLRGMIFAKQPSIKAIDLYLKRFGLLSEKVITETIENGAGRTDEDIEAQLAELDELLDEDK